MYGIIATWRMALEGVAEAQKMLENGNNAGDAIERAVCAVEDFEFYKSVGYGGLPNKEMEVELDAAFMNGTTMDTGGVGAIKDFANPIKIARSLSKEPVNNFLVGAGAEKYAHHHGFQRRNMLTKQAEEEYREYLKKHSTAELSAYGGHDTVGMVCIDSNHDMTAATRTSGLFMKYPGRVGDSPLPGCGYYVDSEAGGATATGLGEDIMKGCLSYEIVRLMKEGKKPQEACDLAVTALDAQLKARQGRARDISVIAMNNKGEWGAATNIECFSFVTALEGEQPTVYLLKKDPAGAYHLEEASEEWIRNHTE